MSKKTLNVKWKFDKNTFLSNQKFQVRIIEKRSAILAATGYRVSRENSRDCWTSFGPTPTRARAHARSCVQRMSAYGNDRPGNAGQAPACCLGPRLPAISSKYRGDYLEKQPRPLQTESISF